MSVYVACEWCQGGVNWEWQHVWLTMLQRAMTAYDDLACWKFWADG
jgi:hypothetical protein